MMKENLIVDTFQSKEKFLYKFQTEHMLSGWKIIQVIPEEGCLKRLIKVKWNSTFS